MAKLTHLWKTTFRTASTMCLPVARLKLTSEKKKERKRRKKRGVGWGGGRWGRLRRRKAKVGGDYRNKEYHASAC